MNPELYALLQKEEGQLFDRKSSKIEPKSVANSLLGFATADGGELVVGITDNKQLEGFRACPTKIEEIRSFIPTWVQPPLKYACRTIPFINDENLEDQILIINVEASPLIHENKKGEVFLRRGKETKLLNFQEREMLAQDKGLQRFESGATDAQPSDLDTEAILEFGRKIGVSSIDPQAILIARDLAELKEGILRINFAGLLLFGKNPQKMIERARIRILRFEGVEEKTGTNLNLVKDQIIEGSILNQLTQTSEVLKAYFRDFTKLDSQSGRFKTVPEYPTFAWLEAVVNAVTHREYSLFGADIQIKIFDDRMEVTSPGNFPSTVKATNIKDIHFSRNPKIARVMCDLGYVREMGEGVNRMYEEMKEAGLPEPRFRGLDGAVSVTLINNVTSRTLRKSADLEQKIKEDILRLLTGKEKTVVFYLLENKTITTSECSELIDQGYDTALNLLKKLKNTNPPILLDHRNSPNDPKSYYYLNPTALMASSADLAEKERYSPKPDRSPVVNPDQGTLI